jgi:two-component system response regulator AlgR
MVDDEWLARERLRTLLGDCTAPCASVEAEAANAAQAMQWLQHHPVDVVLVDIHMPGADGLALARQLKTLAQPPAVVFVTAHAEYAVEAFELEAVDYLTKPVRVERLQAALRKVELLAQSGRALEPDFIQDVLIIQERGRTERVPLSKVLSLKAEWKYITVRTPGKLYIMEGSLCELEEKYKAYFMRIHRNTLIARHAVRSLVKHHDPQEGEGWAVRLEGVQERLSVSRRQLAAVRAMLLNPYS